MRNLSIFDDIESLDSRNEMTSVLVSFFQKLNPINAQIYTYLLQGRVAPLFVDEEFSFSEKSAMKVLENIVDAGDLELDIGELRIELGDAGLVAEEVARARGNRGSTFDIHELYENFWKIVDTKGLHSVRYKSDIFANMIVNASPVDAKYITRIVSGKLRLGCSDKTLLDAFSFMLVGDKSARNLLNFAYGVVADLGLITNIVCSNRATLEKFRKLEDIKPILGIPIFPRLVERVASFKNATERFPEGGIIQPKFDGIRCQIHKGVKKNNIYEDSVWNRYFKEIVHLDLFSSAPSSDVKLFSRNLNDITSMFPDLVAEVGKLDCESCILDGEIVGWDEKKKTYIPFQETMTRKRKYGIEDKVKSIPVRYFAFDVMYFNDNSLMDEDLEKRIDILKGINMGEKYLISMADSVVFSGGEELEKLFQKYVSENLEGIILKEKVGGYSAGSRDFGWVKVKKSIESQVVDTIDTVILGYNYGSGKQVSFGIGALLVGVYNPEKDAFESVGKVGTGVKDADWRNIKNRLAEIELKEKSPNVLSDMSVDVWVDPEVVITVEADEISKSSMHVACSSLLGFGLSLRFPRLIFFDRDKLPEDATSVNELKEMWEMGQK